MPLPYLAAEVVASNGTPAMNDAETLAPASTSCPARAHLHQGIGRVAGTGLVMSAAFSALFIARSGVSVRGQTWWPLFDDAMISMTYARNLADGHGLQWLPQGDRVEGITNLLWTLVMASAHALPIADRHVGLVVMLVAAGLVLAAGVLAHRLTTRLAPGSDIAPGAAVWLVALAYPLLYWSLRGFEVGLLAVCSLVLVLLAIDLRARPSRRLGLSLAVVTVVGLTTRLDFALTVVVVWCLTALPRPSRPLARELCISGGLVAGAMAALAAWRGAYFGDVVPNTLALKIGGVPLSLRLSRGLAWLLFTIAVSVGAALALALPALGRPRRTMPDALRGRWLCVAVFAGQAAYSVFVGGDAWEWMRYANRYVTQALPLLLCVAAVGIDTLASAGSRDHLARLRERALLIASALAVAGLAGWVLDLELYGQEETAVSLHPAVVLAGFAAVLGALPLLLDRLRRPAVAVIATGALVAVLFLPAASWWWLHNAAHVDDDGEMVRLGLLIREVTTPSAEVAVVWAGTPVYVSERAAVDLLGKNDERIAALPPRIDEIDWYPGHMKWDYDLSVFNEDPPDLLAQIYNPTRAEVERLLRAGYVAVDPVPALADLRSKDPAIQHVHALFMFARRDSADVNWSQVNVIERPDLESGIDTISD